MAMKTATTTMTVLFFLAIWVAGNVESATAPAPAVDCSSVILNMADCLTYVINGSTVKTPEGTCCSGLKTVLKSDAECLCEAFKNSGQLGVTLNVTKALALPSACHVSAPSVSNCGLSLGTGAAPEGAISPSTSGGVPTSVTGGNEIVAPAPAPASSGSAALCASIASLFLVLVVASFAFV